MIKPDVSLSTKLCDNAKGGDGVNQASLLLVLVFSRRLSDADESSSKFTRSGFLAPVFFPPTPLSEAGAHGFLLLFPVIMPHSSEFRSKPSFFAVLCKFLRSHGRYWCVPSNISISFVLVFRSIYGLRQLPAAQLLPSPASFARDSSAYSLMHQRVLSVDSIYLEISDNSTPHVSARSQRWPVKSFLCHVKCPVHN
jgi:hypothetical protein